MESSTPLRYSILKRMAELWQRAAERGKKEYVSEEWIITFEISGKFEDHCYPLCPGGLNLSSKIKWNIQHNEWEKNKISHEKVLTATEFLRTVF